MLTKYFLYLFREHLINQIVMPEIVRFYGIIIKMFFKPKEHEPSHIHAIYNEYVGLFNIKTALPILSVDERHGC